MSDKILDFETEAMKKKEEDVEAKKQGMMTEEELAMPVTRSELIDVMTQITENMNQVNDFLMKDVNTLYSNHVFPFQMQLSTVYELMLKKGIFTEEEYTGLYNEKLKDLQERARAVKEEEDGARLATEEEDRVETNKKVLEVLKNKEELDKRLEGKTKD